MKRSRKELFEELQYLLFDDPVYTEEGVLIPCSGVGMEIGPNIQAQRLITALREIQRWEGKKQ